MRVCTRCLHRNENDVAFCASCGAFLNWSSEKVTADGHQGGTAAPRPARRRTTSKRAATARKGAPAAPRTTAPRRDAPTANRRGRTPEDDVAVAAENLRRRIEANRRQRAGLPPLEQPPRSRSRPKAAPEPAPATGEPTGDELPEEEDEERRPGKSDDPGPEQPRKAHPLDDDRRPRQAPIQDDMAAHPGDVVCGRCEAGNAPSRYFCRRCGARLQADEVPAGTGAVAPTDSRRRRWWHRLMWWKRGPDEVPATVADAPSPKQQAVAALPVLLILGLVAAALGPLRPAIGEFLEGARKRFSPRYEQVYPAGVEATSAVEGHPPEAVVDRAPNTYWSEDGPAAGEGEALIFHFDRPVDLGRIGFYNGAQAKPQDFLTQPRLREVHLTFDPGAAASLVLKDRDAFQNYGIDARGVTTVWLRIVSVYPSPQGGTQASLGEVEFYTKT